MYIFSITNTFVPVPMCSNIRETLHTEKGRCFVNQRSMFDVYGMILYEITFLLFVINKYTMRISETKENLIV